MKTKLGQLLAAFSRSGIDNAPVITDDELRELGKGLYEVADFMHDTGNIHSESCLNSLAEQVIRTLWEREA